MRFFAKLSITQKLLVIVMAPTLAALLVACLLLFAFDVAALHQSLKKETTLSAGFAANQLAQPLLHHDAGRASDALNILRRNQHITAACVYDRTGGILARYFRDHEPIDFPNDPSLTAHMHFQGLRLRVFHPIEALDPTRSIKNEVIGGLYLEVDVSPLYRRISLYAFFVSLILVISLFIAYVLAVRLREIISEPVSHLALLAKMVSQEKDYSVRAIKQADDEIGNLVDEFNLMLEQIEKQDRELQQAHDTLEEHVEQRTQQLRSEIAKHKETSASLQEEIRVRRKTEAALSAAKDEAEAASRSKGEFLANMSHEIRTPMNGIIGMTELLLSTPLAPAQEHYAETIRRSGHSLLKIIGDVLDYSKVEAGQLSIEPIPFNLQVACEDVVELLSPRAHEKEIALNLRYAPNAPTRLVGDAGRIRQVLTNLAANAIKFTDEGHVLVNVECIGLTASTAAIRVSVEDTGIGAPPDKLNEIFGKFKQADTLITRKYGGTGLGLAISKQLVELMGGAIAVQSREGVGSRFYFTLTLPLGEEPQPVQQPKADLAGVRVLIVDHSIINQQILSEQFATWGMRADVTGSSIEALRMLREAHEKKDPYQITLLDDQMPSIRGESLGRTVKSEACIQDTRLILLTSLGERGDAQRMIELGFSAYITRPVRQSELMDILAMIWGAHIRGENIGLVTRHTLAESRGAQPCIDDKAAANLTGRILIVEDNMINQQVILEILKTFHCSTDLAANGQEALEKTQQEPYDLILMDCQMPVMDGYTATEEIRAREQGSDRHIPIVAMTAHAMKGDRERCIEAGMDDHFTKPIDSKAVLQILHRWLPKISPETQQSAPEKTFPAPETPGIEPSSDTLPILDPEQVIALTGGNVAMYERITKVFLKHLPERLEELRAAFSEENTPEITRLAHSIQGATGSVGGKRLRQLALQLEMDARNGALDDSTVYLGQLESAFDDLHDVLRRMDFSMSEFDFSMLENASL